MSTRMADVLRFIQSCDRVDLAEIKSQVDLHLVLAESKERGSHIVHRYSTSSRMVEAAETLCEESGYSMVEQTSSHIKLHRREDGFTRLLQLIPQEY